MHVAILHNKDFSALEDDPGRAAREEVADVAAALAEALKEKGRRITIHGVDRDVSSALQAFDTLKPDVVLNLCESLAADSRGEMLVPAFLEVCGFAFSGSSALSLALSLHKHKTKEILLARGVPTPDFRVVHRVSDVVSVDLPFPLIVKPTREDASIGIDFDSVVHSKQALGRAVARVVRTFKQPALVERYIEGKEIYVPLLGNTPRRALPLTEIQYGAAFEGKPKILSYRAKWELDSAECIQSSPGPCSLSAAEQARCIDVANAAFDALECRDYGRVDLRVAADGTCYVIDVNPNCDLHPQAGFAKAAAEVGIPYADLAFHLVELALERSHGHQATRSTRPAAARATVAAHRNVHARRGDVRARAHRHRTQAR